MIKSHTLCQNFIHVNRHNYEWSSLQTFELAFRWFIEAIGDKRLDRIEPIDGEVFKSYCIETGRSRTSANMWLRSIKRVLNWSVEQGLLSINPLSKAKQFRLTRNPVLFYEDWQVERMIEFAPDLRWKAIILCGWTTGLRRGAILNLTKDNVRGGFIHVEPKRRTDRTWPWQPKTKEIRMVPAVEQLTNMIDSLGCFYPFLAFQRYARLLFLQSRDMLDARKRKTPEENFRRTFVSIQKKAFGRQIGDFHRLRKTYTTNMIEKLPDHVVMQLTGHKDRKTLTYYTGIRQSFYEDARKIVSDRLKNGSLVLTESRTKEVG